MSWATDLSPTTRGYDGAGPDDTGVDGWEGEGCTRGMGDWGGLGGLYRYPPQDPPKDPYSVIFSLRVLPTAK